MKSMKKTLSCILALTIAASMYAMPAYAEEESAAAAVVGAADTAETEVPEEEPAEESSVTENGFTISSDGVITAYSGSGGNIVIPDTIGGITVTEIGVGAFTKNYNYNINKITGITFPNTLKRIDNYAFTECIYSTTSLVKTKDGFEYYSTRDPLLEVRSCKIKKLVIPDSVEYIGLRAFEGCTELEEIIIGKNVKTIGDGAFCCGQNRYYDGDRYWIDNIPSKVKSVVLPDSLETLGAGAFYGQSNITEVTFGKNLSTIGYNAFQGCTKLTSAELPERLVTLGSGCFKDNTALETVTFGPRLQSIGTNAFDNCPKITSIELPNSLTELGVGVFRDDSGLTSVKLGSGLKKLDQSVFRRCSSLTAIDIPDSVSEIGETCFEGCTKLASIKLPASLTKLCQQTISSTAIRELTIPDSVTELETNAVSDCPQLKTVVLGSGLKTIYNADFATGCEKLTNITIPASITELGSTALSKNAISTVTYLGTKAKWQALMASNSSSYIAKNYENWTVVCTDGTLPEIVSLTATAEKGYTVTLGDDLDKSRITVVATKSNGSKVTMTADDKSVTVTGFDMTKVGQQTLTVSYFGTSTTLDITVTEEIGEKKTVGKDGSLTEILTSINSEAKKKGYTAPEGGYIITIPEGEQPVGKAISIPDVPVKITAESRTKLVVPSITSKGDLVLKNLTIVAANDKPANVTAKKALTMINCSAGNVTVNGSPTLSEITVNGNLKLSAKADKSGVLTDTLKNVTVTGKVTTNNNIVFDNCPSIGTVTSKGTVTVTGDETKAVAITASAKTGESVLENIEIAKKLTVKDKLTLNGTVKAANAVSCAELNSADGAELSFLTLAVNKNGISENSDDISLIMLDKYGAEQVLTPGKKDIVVIKTFKKGKEKAPDASKLSLGGKSEGVTLSSVKNKVIVPKV